MEQLTKTSARALGAALEPRQLNMMGLGSAIGAGLSIGSGIQAAGPAVLYLLPRRPHPDHPGDVCAGRNGRRHSGKRRLLPCTVKAYEPVAGAAIGWPWWIQLVVVIAA